MKFEEIVEDIAVLSVDGICVSYRGSDDQPPKVLWANQAYCDMFHISPEDAFGMHPREIHHWDYQDDFQSSFDDAVLAGQDRFTIDTLCLRRDQSSFWASISMTILRDDTGPGRHAISCFRDIDNLKNREQSAELALIENQHLLEKIEATQTRLVNAINMIPDPFAIYDAKDRITIWNPAFERDASDDPTFLKKGLKKERILREAVQSGFIASAIGREDEFISKFMAGWRANDSLTALLRIRDRDYRLMRTTAPNGDRVVLGVDISDHLRQQDELKDYADKLEKANREITEQALHDELTGLGNRRHLQGKLDGMIARRARDGSEIAALHIDLDRFKQINDTMGHAAGDHVLRVVADILRNKVRSSDVIARIGGDEFVVLMVTGANSDQPEVLADRIVTEVSKPIPFDGRLCRLGASVGIARTPVVDPTELLTCSDIALYKAKEGGRSTKAVFNKIDLENLRAMKSLGDDIQRGLENNEFVPHFQPQFDAVTGQVVAYEVLARWNHPENGLMEPDDFLDTAAEIQVDEHIDRIIFQLAMRDCAQLTDIGAELPEIAFNVSLARVMSNRVLTDIDACAYPGQISFELIETTFFDGKSEATLARLKLLQDIGVQLEVDDFGSGSASIVGLRHIGPSRVKIDHRLVESIGGSESARKLVQSIVDIGRTLNLGVTGEGVETARQAEILRDVGCDRLQGYHLGKPLPLAHYMANGDRRHANGT